MTTFDQLGLSNQVLKAIKKLGFEHPTQIQKEAIPPLLAEDRDLIGLAQTGTGKTAAFGLPLIERIDVNNQFTQGLILAPTRELGQQIADQIMQFGSFHKKLRILAVYGGASIAQQIKALDKPVHIIIATPGRLLDLIRRRAVNLSMLEVLVLDEADEMVNMGFKEELDEILTHTPEEKCTWLFSATMPPPIKRIVNTYMKNPIEININREDKVNVNITHEYVLVEHGMKSEALMRFLDIDPSMRAVVFCRTRRDTQELAEMLARKEYKADALHGDLSQGQRDNVMNRFRNHQINTLIATDVAARGIDVNDLSHVFHYSMPDEQQYYTHRSGRTARAGKKGTSILFISNRDKKKVRYLEQDLGIQLEARGIPSSSEIKEIRLEKWCVDILGQHPKGKLDPEMVAKVHILFGALSKEELINKLIAKELESLDHAQTDHPAQNFHHVQQQHRSRRSSHTQGNFKKRRGRSDSHKSKRAGSYKRR